MKISTNREKTEIVLGKGYCFNYDKIIDAAVLLAAQTYWEDQGQWLFERYSDTSCAFYSKHRHRNYLRMKLALDRFEGMTEEDIFEEWAYSLGRAEHKYHKTIETLIELKGYMWT